MKNPFDQYIDREGRECEPVANYQSAGYLLHQELLNNNNYRYVGFCNILLTTQGFKVILVGQA